MYVVMQNQPVTFFSCSVVLFVDEADAFLSKRSKVAIVCMTDNLAKRGRRGVGCRVRGDVGANEREGEEYN